MSWRRVGLRVERVGIQVKINVVFCKCAAGTVCVLLVLETRPSCCKQMCHVSQQLCCKALDKISLQTCISCNFSR